MIDESIEYGRDFDKVKSRCEKAWLGNRLRIGLVMSSLNRELVEVRIVRMEGISVFLTIRLYGQEI